MAISFEKSVRRVVPRWHSLSDAIRSGELDPIELNPKQNLAPNSFLIEKERLWLDSPNLFSALDLVNASVVLGETIHAKEAAHYILTDNQGVSKLAREAAARLLGDAQIPNSSKEKILPPELRSKLREQKSRRVIEPRNAFVWCELARLYALLGMPGQAERPMEVALLLAPHDRFVVRSTTRFLLHAGKPDEALFVLRRCARTPSDPWLLAAEAAVSSVLDKTPRFAKNAAVLVGDTGINPLHTSELSAALASIEMWRGNSKKAKQLFARTLQSPSENALAQVVWAADELGFQNFESTASRITNAFEAQALDANNTGNWRLAIRHCDDWAGIESFSSRPYSMASCIATSLLKKHADAIEMARAGLSTNRNHPLLLNNIAFAFAELGNPEQAMKELNKVDLERTSLSVKICHLATGGLIAYRGGDSIGGRDLYEKAISFAGRNNQPKLKATAQIYLAREEARLGHPGYGELFDAGSRELKVGNDEFAKTLVTVVGKDIEDIGAARAAEA